MSKTIKFVIGLAGFIIFMAIVTITYNWLTDFEYWHVHDEECGHGTGFEQESHHELETHKEHGQNNDQANDHHQPTPPVQETDKEKAPDFTMFDREGNSIALSDFTANEKPIVLNFWASWCPPCRAEMPDFEKVFLDFGDEVQFIMLNLADGSRETIESASNFIEENGYTFPIFFDDNNSGAFAYGIRSIPTTIFIDKNGFINDVMIGALDERTLRRGIDKLFE